MPTCPRGHSTTATDWCDVCGRSMTAAAPAPEPDPSLPGVPAGPETCPLCRTQRAGRFCEVDGYDFMTATLLEDPGPPAPAPDAASAATRGTRTGEVAPGPVPVAAAVAVGPAAVVTVTADRMYFEIVRTAGGPDAAGLVFPEHSPERRYPLRGSQLLIGRRSRSRGIAPDIDLAGPPQDPGISHAHALLLPQHDGTWAVVDLGSANGTYVNDPARPIPARAPVPVKPGDRVYAGAWTALTVG